MFGESEESSQGGLQHITVLALIYLVCITIAVLTPWHRLQCRLQKPTVNTRCISGFLIRAFSLSLLL